MTNDTAVEFVELQIGHVYRVQMEIVRIVGRFVGAGTNGAFIYGLPDGREWTIPPTATFTPAEECDRCHGHGMNPTDRMLRADGRCAACNGAGWR